MSVQMYDRRIPLKPGTTLLCQGGTRYEVKSLIGRGGNSLIYRVVSDDSAQYLALKEWYPYRADVELARENGFGAVLPVNADSEFLLREGREALEKEAQISQLVRNKTRKVISLSQLHIRSIELSGNSVSAKKALYYLMEDASSEVSCTLQDIINECALPAEDGHPLRTGGRPSLKTSLTIVRELLTALERIHAAGFVHGDIQYNNVLFFDPMFQDGTIGTASFIDFGASAPLLPPDENGQQKTAPVPRDQITSTWGFCPPEMADNMVTLSPQSDLYSLGRVLLGLVTGAPLRHANRQSADRDVMMSDMKSLHIPSYADSKVLHKELNVILRTALARKPEERYSSAKEMRDAVEQLLEQLRPPRHKLAADFSTLNADTFRGRENEIAEIINRVQTGEKETVLYGMGGIGKTETAIEAGRRLLNTHNYEVYFVHFKQNFFDTVVSLANQFSDYSTLNPDGNRKMPDQIYSEVKKMLQEQHRCCVLIIDNVDSEEKSLSELCAEKHGIECPYHDALSDAQVRLLLTTREIQEDPSAGVSIERLPDELLLEIFRRFVSEKRCTTADAQHLIDTVEGHTLTVELIARTLKADPLLKPLELRKRLMEDDISDGKLPSVGTYKDRNAKELYDGQKKKITEYLEKLFQINNLPIEEQEYMFIASLIGDSGLELNLFSQILLNYDTDQMNHLLERGWLRCSDDNILTIHPLIREVCRKASPFKWVITDKINITSLYQPSQELLENHGRSEFISNLGLLLEKPQLVEEAACVYYQHGDYKRALEWALRSLGVLNGTNPNDNEAHIDLYLLLSNIYAGLMDFSNAVDYSTKALRMVETLLELPSKDTLVSSDCYSSYITDCYNPLLAVCYSTFGNIYKLSCDYSKALEYYRAALLIWEKNLPVCSASTVISDSYQNISTLYEALGDNNKAQEYQHKLQALENAEPAIQ